MTKQVQSPYNTRSTCKKHGLKEGDEFVVVKAGNGVPLGTIVTLARDDNSVCPYFSVPGFKTHRALYLWRLGPKKVKAIVNEISPYEDSGDATCARYGLKVGDKFEVINADRHSEVVVGDVLTLLENDGTATPYFIQESTGREVCVCLYRLVPLVVNPAQGIATLSTVDEFKSEIDALRTKAKQKREQIAKISEEIAEVNVAIKEICDKFKASLDGYI